MPDLLNQRSGWLGREDSASDGFEYDTLGDTFRLVQEYDRTLQQLEDEAIARINKSLEQSFRVLADQLSRTYRRELEALQRDPATMNERAPERSAEVLKRLRGLLERINPRRARVYRQIFQQLLQDATALGLEFAERLTAQSWRSPDPFIAASVSIPIDAVAQAALSARAYLGDAYGSEMSNRITNAVQVGLATGASVPDIQRSLKTIGGVVANRAEMIARTESVQAANRALLTGYAANGVDLLIYWATEDERTCPYCGPRAGCIYRLNDLRQGDRFGVLLHPRCRCTFSATSLIALSIEPEQLQELQEHAESVASRMIQFKRRPQPTALSAAPFERYAGRQAPRPAWSPTGGWMDTVLRERFNSLAADDG